MHSAGCWCSPVHSTTRRKRAPPVLEKTRRRPPSQIRIQSTRMRSANAQIEIQPDVKPSSAHLFLVVIGSDDALSVVVLLPVVGIHFRLLQCKQQQCGNLVGPFYEFQRVEVACKYVIL